MESFLPTPIKDYPPKPYIGKNKHESLPLLSPSAATQGGDLSLAGSQSDSLRRSDSKSQAFRNMFAGYGS